MTDMIELLSFEPSLVERDAIISSIGIPARCVRCTLQLPAPVPYETLMINSAGDAVVTQPPASLCPGCSAAYFQERDLNHIAKLFDLNPYTIVGFIDLNALPPEHRDKPLGEDPSIPLPLADFVNVTPLKVANFDSEEPTACGS